MYNNKIHYRALFTKINKEKKKSVKPKNNPTNDVKN